MSSFVQVALPLPLFKTFTYSVPTDWRDRDLLGMRVSVPFGRRTLTGVIVELAEASELPKVRDILDLLDPDPLFTPEMLRFAEWLSRYYVSPLGDTLRSMLPQGMTPESSTRLRLASPDAVLHVDSLRRTAPRQAAILSALSDHPKGISLPYLQKKVGAESLYSQLESLVTKGLIIRTDTSDRGVQARTVRGVRLAPALLDDDEEIGRLFDELDRTAPKQAQILSILYTQLMRIGNDYIFASEVLEAARASDSALKGLAARGAVEIENIEVSREELLAVGAEDATPQRPTTEEDNRTIVLNPAQQNAVDLIGEATDLGSFRTFLLHGVTGSGKTQVYIDSIRRVIATGKKGLMLVPEIALTLQLVERFVAAFGDRVVLLHSRMSPGERYDGWRRAASGGCDVVIGARSALFAPLRDIGIIVVDEEHEGSYKQYDAQPRYHARDAAIVRAQIAGAVAVLGSATPSIESYFNAERGKYTLLELPERVDNAREPKVVVVDTVTARRQNLMRGTLSVRLISEIRARIQRKEGVILLQNRRGFATRLECMACSHTPMCPHCAVTLTYHKRKEELHCHYCGYIRAAEKTCELCGNHDLRQPGVGTQKVEEELEAEIPEARVIRMDLDTTSRKGAHRAILSAFAHGEIDVLVGTQMVAKGLDFSRVSLVGVISADTQLLLPDFRATERTYQLLTQVSGRAGRRSEVEGEVVIQTGHPDHMAIRASFAKDYMAMYNEELATRRELNYPPFSRFIVIEFRGEDQRETENHARYLRTLLPEESDIMEVNGPTAALIWKLRNQFRYQIVIKNSRTTDPGGKRFYEIFSDAGDRYHSHYGRSDVQMVIDVDAQGMG